MILDRDWKGFDQCWLCSLESCQTNKCDCYFLQKQNLIVIS